MKKHFKQLLTIFLLFFFAYGFSQMELLINTENIDGTTIELHLSDSVNAIIDWGDGNSQTVTSPNIIEHNYEQEGSYSVKIEGSLSWFGSDKINQSIDAFESVLSFGDLGLKSLKNAFTNATNIKSVPQTLPPSVENLKRCFSNIDRASILNLDRWDVSNVTDMSFIFISSEIFNQDLGNWNVSNVTDMSYMFFHADNFNQDIGNWDVGNVSNMTKMFGSAREFNQDIGRWNVSKVTNMNGLFSNTYFFNQDIGLWDVSNVTNMDYMFWGAFSMNVDISGWCVEKIPEEPPTFLLNNQYQEDINLPFWGHPCSSMKLVYNTNNLAGTTIGIPLSGNVNVVVNWGDDSFDSITSEGYFEHTYNSNGIYQVSITGELSRFGLNYADQGLGLVKVVSFGNLGITSLKSAFRYAENLISVPSYLPSSVTNLSECFAYTNQVIFTNLDVWDVSNVTDMSLMFYRVSNFNQNLGSWDVSNVTDMSLMFVFTDDFNQDISKWDVRNVANMRMMFYSAKAFNQDIGNWDVSMVHNMDRMFDNGVTFNQNISGWCVEQIHSLPYDFSRYSPLQHDYLPFWGKQCGSIKLVFNTNLIQGTTIGLSLSGSSNALIDWGDDNIDTISSDGYFEHTYYYDGIYNVSILGELSWFGSDFPNPTLGALMTVADFGSAGISSLENAFSKADNLKHVPYNLPSVITNLSNCFSFINQVKIHNLDRWDVSNVTNMSKMFYSAVNFNHNIEEWNVCNVNDMSYMFYNANKFDQDIGNWDVGNVTDMSYMFYNARSFNKDIGSWDVSSISNMNFMFSHAILFNQEINTWDVRNVLYMRDMFSNECAFNNDVNSWDVSKVIDMHNMFYRAFLFNQHISNWDVSNVNDMSGMFEEASSFNQNISGWDVRSVTDMRNMFDDASSFNQDISDWCVVQFTEEPSGFCIYSPLDTIFQPHWGFPCIDAIVDISELKSILVFPNPFTTSSNFEYNLIESTTVQISIYNQLGEQVEMISEEQQIGQQKVVWDATGLQSGIYFYRLQIGDKTASGKLVIFR